MGIAADVNDRVKHIQFCCPMKIDILLTRLFLTRREAREAERAIHKKYDHTRTWGEWFNIAGENIIGEVAAQYTDRIPEPQERRPSFLEHVELVKKPAKCYSVAPKEMSMERMREIAKTLEF